MAAGPAWHSHARQALFFFSNPNPNTQVGFARREKQNRVNYAKRHRVAQAQGDDRMTRPESTTVEAPKTESLEQQFRRLEGIWEAETLVLSDAHRIIEYPAFQEIIRLGSA